MLIYGGLPLPLSYSFVIFRRPSSSVMPSMGKEGRRRRKGKEEDQGGSQSPCCLVFPSLRLS